MGRAVLLLGVVCRVASMPLARDAVFLLSPENSTIRNQSLPAEAARLLMPPAPQLDLAPPPQSSPVVVPLPSPAAVPFSSTAVDPLSSPVAGPLSSTVAGRHSLVDDSHHVMYIGQNGSRPERVRWYVEATGQLDLDNLYINTDTMSQGFIGVLLAIALVILAYECFFGEKVVHNFRVRNNVEGILALADTQQGDVADAKQGGAGGDTKASDEEDQPRPKWVKNTLFLGGLVASMTGELYYGVVVPFLPPEAEYRGVPSGTIGLIIACHALGALTIGSWAPILLRTRDPTALMRSSLVAEICLALVCALCGGLEGAAFGSVFGICRFLLGGCVSINEVCNFAIAYRVVPTDKIPNVTAIVFFMRGFGTMAGPSIGGALYEVGGFALPLVAITPAFLLLYLMFVYACSYDPGMAPVPTTASVLGLLKIKPIWAALIGTPFLVYFLIYAMEPMYSKVLSEDPYNLDTSEVGLMASIVPLTQTVMIVVAMLLSKFIAPVVQQAIGVAILFTACLLLGPSPLLPFLDKTQGLFITALVCIGIGSAMFLPTHPLFMLRILYREAGLTKKELGGAMAAVSTDFMYSGAIIAPTVSSLVVEAIGFEDFTTIWAFVYVTAWLPCIWVLSRYNAAE